MTEEIDDLMEELVEKRELDEPIPDDIEFTAPLITEGADAGGDNFPRDVLEWMVAEAMPRIARGEVFAYETWKEAEDPGRAQGIVTALNVVGAEQYQIECTVRLVNTQEGRKAAKLISKDTCSLALLGRARRGKKAGGIRHRTRIRMLGVSVIKDRDKVK
jgi:hypothetical protein